MADTRPREWCCFCGAVYVCRCDRKVMPFGIVRCECRCPECPGMAGAMYEEEPHHAD